MSSSQLFKPLQVGTVSLQHRIILAPLTRLKATAEHVPFLPLVAEYYGQRASRPGTLLITEATFIAARAGGYPHIPGIWSPAQIEAWRAVADTVHAKGSFMFMQLWALGRAASAALLLSESPEHAYVSASDVPLAGSDEVPRALTIAEINEYVALYAQAAKNAIAAGMDGVEIHNANGYLPDQFLQDVSNTRTDEYGGSIENRARFTLAVVDAVAAAVGAELTAVRLSPWSPFQGMRMADPLPTFAYVLSALAARQPGLAYVHLIEPRISGNDGCEGGAQDSNESLRALWPGPLVRAGGFARAEALQAAEGGDMIAFGRLFISNPDLPTRLEKDVPLAAYDRETFYLVGENHPRGYTDQPFAVSA
ncbi:hypothetical protein B0H15DRAFT_940643 [Mycena belliarum]|uniref:NADH:flavin oxidoreductase/NADH oxidase N-terminal domain-containing protein n=1 Tax=Mycena belliarum TaxID=1033014 RepID=A0AAD6XDQ1_9AGAR|nr:hypothetical protein B0H15DRAFT_941901 [Mycena belliae]KAJ7080187.1 hypothetical protein B0H15DRAFT_940643 [Mycena belliae]